MATTSHTTSALCHWSTLNARIALSVTAVSRDRETAVTLNAMRAFNVDQWHKAEVVCEVVAMHARHFEEERSLTITSLLVTNLHDLAAGDFCDRQCLGHRECHRTGGTR